MTQNARLEVTSGPRRGRTHPLAPAPLVVGRDPRNEIVVDRPEISRRHARFVPRHDGWVVEDLESTNGTFLNGQRVVTAQPLEDGDVISLGDTLLLTFRLAPPSDDEKGQDAVELDPAPRSPKGAEQPPAGGATTVLDDRTSPVLPDRTPTVNGGPRRQSNGQLTWIWIGAAFTVLLTVAVIALLLILRLTGTLSFPLRRSFMGAAVIWEPVLLVRGSRPLGTSSHRSRPPGRDVKPGYGGIRIGSAHQLIWRRSAASLRRSLTAQSRRVAADARGPVEARNRWGLVASSA